jgi:hypothetical protein
MCRSSDWKFTRSTCGVEDWLGRDVIIGVLEGRAHRAFVDQAPRRQLLERFACGLGDLGV